MNRLSEVRWRYGGLAVALMALCATIAWAAPGDHQVWMERPVPMGITGGNIEDWRTQGPFVYCCGGTLGGLVENAGGTIFILSNNHVLARVNQAAIGEDIVQPSILDDCFNPDPANAVADLSDFVALDFGGGTNYVDAAIAEIRAGAVDTSGTVLEIGTLGSDTLAAYVGLNVKKSGRTTGLTFGAVDSVDVSVNVGYTSECGLRRADLIGYFENQFIVTPGTFSDGGDSGSVIVEDTGSNPRAVGLLFAGSSSYTIANPIDNVLSALNVAMLGGGGPECQTNADCNDDNECTNDVCNVDVCEYTNVPDNTTCTGGVCCSGTCTVPICETSADCDDQEACTTDECVAPTSCGAFCENTWPACGISDGCCGPTCDSSNDPDCPSGPVCGNDICEIDLGEDCRNCSDDCNGVTTGRPSGRYCCGDDVDCNDPRCTGGGNTCQMSGASMVIDPPGNGPIPPGLARASAVKKRNSARLFAIPDVVGHGISLDANGNVIIKVFLARESADVRAQIPAALENVPVRVEVTGPFEAR
ncbi:MAG: hypothetical protein JSU63_10545 [Phycisphaerales bacterium]|nr:MAG: hypothetical protein JSU63_10545 [Phycisphaerales bacterium]